MRSLGSLHGVVCAVIKASHPRGTWLYSAIKWHTRRRSPSIGVRARDEEAWVWAHNLQRFRSKRAGNLDGARSWVGSLSDFCSGFRVCAFLFTPPTSKPNGRMRRGRGDLGELDLKTSRPEQNLSSRRREMFMSGLAVRYGSISGPAVLYPPPGPGGEVGLSAC